MSSVVAVSDGKWMNGAGQFPRRVQTRLNGCRQRLLAAAEGDLLDLNLTGSPALVEAAVATAVPLDSVPEPEAGEVEIEGPDAVDLACYDMAIGVAALSGVSDCVRFLGGVASLLRPDGVLWIVEPAYRPGLAAALTTTMWSRHRTLRDLHVGRNLIVAIRSHGFTITDLERLNMPTTVQPLRTFVSIRAERFGR